MILDSPFLHVDDLTVDVDLVAELRRLHAGGVEVPCFWSVAAGSRDPYSPEQISLHFGVNGGLGMLQWNESGVSLVPEGGTNAQWSVYQLGGLHETPIPPRAEVPLETVYSALAEFLETRRRPTRVRWQEAASIESMFEQSTEADLDR